MQLALPLPSMKTPFWQCKIIQARKTPAAPSFCCSHTAKHSQIHVDSKNRSYACSGKTSALMQRSIQDMLTHRFNPLVQTLVLRHGIK